MQSFSLNLLHPSPKYSSLTFFHKTCASSLHPGLLWECFLIHSLRILKMESYRYMFQWWNFFWASSKASEMQRTITWKRTEWQSSCDSSSPSTSNRPGEVRLRCTVHLITYYLFIYHLRTFISALISTIRNA